MPGSPASQKASSLPSSCLVLLVDGLVRTGVGPLRAADTPSPSLYVLDRRLRSSDLEWSFSHTHDVQTLESLKAREEAAVAEGRTMFESRAGANDPYTPQEARVLGHAPECAVSSDRIDICTWLMDGWGAAFVGRKGKSASRSSHW